MRAGLALRSLNAGESTTEAIARIRRVHFDYSEANEWDQTLRPFIPFWTFMSRNLPLQVQQMYLKPRAYAQYNSLKRNFDIDTEGGMFMPEYMRDKGGFFVSPGVGLMPDIGSNQIQEQLAMVTNPRQAAVLAEPGAEGACRAADQPGLLLRVAVQGQRLSEDGCRDVALRSIAGSNGGGRKDTPGSGDGEEVRQRDYDLIPFLAQANRLGSTTTNREGKGWQSLLNYVGVPVRTVSAEDEQKDILAQRRASRRQDPNAARMEALRQFG